MTEPSGNRVKQNIKYRNFHALKVRYFSLVPCVVSSVEVIFPVNDNDFLASRHAVSQSCSLSSRCRLAWARLRRRQLAADCAESNYQKNVLTLVEFDVGVYFYVESQACLFVCLFICLFDQ